MVTNKQTAVQWLVEQLGLDATTDYKDEIQQALQMEQEYTVDAYIECYMNHVGNGESIVGEANRYYKSVYGGDKEGVTGRENKPYHDTMNMLGEVIKESEYGC